MCSRPDRNFGFRRKTRLRMRAGGSMKPANVGVPGGTGNRGLQPIGDAATWLMTRSNQSIRSHSSDV